MPAECSYCGEYKPCRKIMVHCDLTSRPEWSFNEWICEECDKAQSIIKNEERIENIKKQKINRANWIKVRDKILKQNDK